MTEAHDYLAVDAKHVGKTQSCTRTTLKCVRAARWCVLSACPRDDACHKTKISASTPPLQNKRELFVEYLCAESVSIPKPESNLAICGHYRPMPYRIGTRAIASIYYIYYIIFHRNMYRRCDAATHCMDETCATIYKYNVLISKIGCAAKTWCLCIMMGIHYISAPSAGPQYTNGIALDWFLNMVSQQPCVQTNRPDPGVDKLRRT